MFSLFKFQYKINFYFIYLVRIAILIVAFASLCVHFFVNKYFKKVKKNGRILTKKYAFVTTLIMI